MTQVKAYIITLFLMTALFCGYSAAATGSLSVAATITSWGYCFVTGNADVAFDSPLDPLNPQDVQADGSIRVWCMGFPGSFTVGVTQSTPSPLYLENGEEKILYTLDLPPGVTGRAYRTITIPVTARIQGSAYQVAPAGSYTDTVTVQITP